MTRRRFLQHSSAAGALAGLGSAHLHAADALVSGLPCANALNWRVGFATYSFRTVSVFEALEKTAATGLHYAELFAWQPLSPDNPHARPTAELSATLKQDLKKKAADLGVKIIGIYSKLENPESTKAMFDFASEMDMEVIVGEPPLDLMDTIEELTEKYKVDFALHNHPKPSRYWNPEIGLAALEMRSDRMGFCCDTGHWCRSGLDPVEMLQKIGPRVKTFHLKDLNQFGVLGAKDVIWGEGEGRVAAILAEVKRSDIPKPYFSIEWERDPNEPIQTHAKSAEFFEKVACAYRT
ncbi:TIM barrel protein [Blastopirellula sp. J2-11]|uniref:TIM barrel protein n=1 Tax=Blastopirellula sp. J2-11 TaxID=2943192 RepID=UPI0021C775EE|nr:TIM barrel protein [Blastopirellula sp. J2-11]UUO06428.1 TIM barrel protein [Blastopirellula sp. J2-11]